MSREQRFTAARWNLNANEWPRVGKILEAVIVEMLRFLPCFQRRIMRIGRFVFLDARKIFFELIEARLLVLFKLHLPPLFSPRSFHCHSRECSHCHSREGGNPG